MREDWVECTFEDLTASLKRGPFGGDLKKEFFVEYGYKVYEQQHAINNDFSIGRYYIDEDRFDKLKACKVEAGDYIVSCSGTMGKIARLPKDAPTGIINQALMRVTINENIINPNYFLQYFRSNIFQAKILNDSRGTGMQNMAAIKEIKPIQVLLPPLPIQRAIVLKIENLFASLDKGIADLKTAQEQLKVYRQAVLKKAFEGGFTNSKMHFLKLINVTTTLGDGLHGTPKYSENGEYYFINGNNLSDGKILIKPDTKRVDKEEFEKYKKDLNQTTVFVSINGTIGNTAFYKGEAVILGKSACYFNVNEGISKEYIRYNLKTSEFINYAIRNATGSTIKNVGLKTMRDYLVPLPINKAEQHAIVSEIESRLSVCDKVEQSISEALAKAEALRQSILKKAFEGKLLSEAEIAKCKQEADYEPASVLLERIKKEKHHGK